eukprot:6208694-Pleurochrysis_carterae.AAC.2
MRALCTVGRAGRCSAARDHARHAAARALGLPRRPRSLQARRRLGALRDRGQHRSWRGLRTLLAQSDFNHIATARALGGR